MGGFRLTEAARRDLLTEVDLQLRVFENEPEYPVPHVERIAYLAELASVQLQGLKHLVLVDAKSPVSFFAYPGKASDLVPEGCTVHTLASPTQDAVGGLERLVDLGPAAFIRAANVLRGQGVGDARRGQGLICAALAAGGGREDGADL